MLIIDSVKYELWTPQKEVEEFHPHVKEHYREIFGANSLFIEGKRLESESGKGSVPDGFVLTLGEATQWHIVEMELSTHQLYDHIVNQVGRFINGVKNTVTQRKIIEAIYQQIQENKQRKAEFEEAIGSGEIYKLLSDLISKSPVLTIIIEKRTRELDEALDLLRYSPIKIVEFQTFVREGTGLAVHAHLFEPLHPLVTIEVPLKPRGGIVAPPTETELEHALTQRDLKLERFRIPAKYKWFFPPPPVEFELIIGQDIVKTNGRGTGALFIRRNIRNWFRMHR